MVMKLGPLQVLQKIEKCLISEPPAWPKSLGFSDSRHVSPVGWGGDCWSSQMQFKIPMQDLPNKNIKPNLQIK